MRAVVTRVTSAAVTVSGETVGAIGAGLLVLVGVGHDDTAATAAALARRVAGLRILRDEVSLTDLGAPEALVVSQFTLLADTRRGRRPGWSRAAPGPVAAPSSTSSSRPCTNWVSRCRRDVSAPTWRSHRSTTAR